MSKFPATIKTASNAKALHHAMPSALEGRSSVDDEDELCEAIVADMFSISVPYSSIREEDVC